MVDAPPGATLSVDESGFERTAYARLVRKGGGAATAVASLEAEARVRSALVGETGGCPGVALGVAGAPQSFSPKPPLGWGPGGVSKPRGGGPPGHDEPEPCPGPLPRPHLP